jgi:UDP-N-acetylmuramoyl-tripeptide--D-alanyl-D-alanine ligase
VFARNSVHSLPDGPDYILDTHKAPLWTVGHGLAFIEKAKAPRKTFVVGTLSDYVGGGSDAYRKVARQALQVADRVVFVGQHSSYVSKLRKDGIEKKLFAFMTVYQASTFLNEAPLASELIYLKGTAKDHMERIMLDRFDRVMCWKERCGKGYPCQYCRSYRQPHPPPFGVEGAETVGEADAEPASSEVAPSL